MAFGSAMGMIISIRNNSRRKVHEAFAKDKTYKTKKDSLTDYDFPDATPEQLKIIKEKLRAYNRRVFIKSTIITIIILSILIYAFLTIKV